MASYYEYLLRMGQAPQPLPSSAPCGYSSYIGTAWCPPRPVVTSCEKTVGSLDDEEITSLLRSFQSAYPEVHMSLHDSSQDNPEPGLQYYIMVVKRLHCLYPGYTCVDDQCQIERFFLLLAHYLVMSRENGGGDFNVNTVASVSTGDASISFNTVYTDSLGGNPFYLWLSKTPYGNALLMYIKSQQGYPVIV